MLGFGLPTPVEKFSSFSPGLTPGWVQAKYGAYGPLPSIATDFANNLHWVSGAGSSTADAAYSNTRASTEYAVDNSGNWTSFANNTLARTNAGLNIWESRTNLFLNSQAPVTQTITVVSTTVYTVSVYGTSSIVLSGAGSGTVTQGNPVTFTASTTSLTCTVSGAGGAFQNVNVEAGAFATPPIKTAGTSALRVSDIVTLNTVPTFGSAFTLFSKAIASSLTPTSYNLSIDDGTNGNRALMYRAATTGAASYILSNVANYGSGSGASYVVGTPLKTALALTISDQAFVVGGTASSTSVATANPTVNKVHVGIRSDGANTTQWQGQITDIAFWASTRVPTANLQALTGATW